MEKWLFAQFDDGTGGFGMFMSLEQNRSVDDGKDGVVPQKQCFGIAGGQGDGRSLIIFITGGVQRLHAGVFRARRQFFHGSFAGRLGRSLVRIQGGVA